MIMKLITEETFDMSVKPEGENGTLFIEGIFSTADIQNHNGRKYKKPILEREIEKLNKLVENKSAWGELGHPPTPKINEDKIAILIRSLQWDGNNVMGKAEILDTPMGQIAKTLISKGRMGISSRGLGTVNETDGYVNDDYNLLAYDLITNPSNDPSWVKGIYEGQEFDSPIKIAKINEVNEEILKDQAKKEYVKHIWQILDSIERKL